MLGTQSEKDAAFRAAFIVDSHNVFQHASLYNLNLGRNHKDTLKTLDTLQTDELCAFNRPVRGETF